MLTRKSIVVGLIVLATVVISPSLLQALSGDCNGDGSFNISDAVVLSNYFFTEMAAYPLEDCDCDGHPGITIGDYIQMMNAVETSTCFPQPSGGTDMAVASQVKFYFNGLIDFGASPPRASIQIDVDVPAGFDVETFSIPFSFAADPGGQVLEVAGMDFTGSVAAQTGGYINNDDKYFVVNGGLFEITTSLPGGTSGKLCTVNFNLVSQPTDNPTELRITTNRKYRPMIFHEICYSGIDGQRIFLPEFMRAPYGDVNSDRSVNVSDAVYIINYIFVGGPRPGDKEPW